MPFHFVTLALLLLFAPSLQADEGLVPLKHRPADELSPLTTPFLEPDERAVASGDQLILSASPERLHRLASIVRALDRPLRLLHLSLRRDPPPPQGVRRYYAGEPKVRRITVAEGVFSMAMAG